MTDKKTIYNAEAREKERRELALGVEESRTRDGHPRNDGLISNMSEFVRVTKTEKGRNVFAEMETDEQRQLAATELKRGQRSVETSEPLTSLE